MERIQKYEPLWGKWTVKRKLGEGSFGAVYEAESEKFGNKSSCAVKFISFKNAEMLQGVNQGETLSPEELEQLKIEEAKKNVREAVLMEKLQGRDHIVTIYDYDIFPGKSTTDVIIRMEQLMNLNDYMRLHKQDSEEQLKKTVIKLGIDIGKALEDCEKEKIVHRDIKPDNLFVNKNGTFKLGDFGLSRKMSKSASFSLRKSAGTPLYMAPEALGWGRKTDTLSDIYSLGIVMYQLLNDGNIPFAVDMKSYDGVDEAIDKRADGEELPAPKYEQSELWKIIQKACRFKRENRYQSAKAFRKELEKIKNGAEVEKKQQEKKQGQNDPETENKQSQEKQQSEVKNTNIKEKEAEKKQEKSKLASRIISIVLIILMLGYILLYLTALFVPAVFLLLVVISVKVIKKVTNKSKKDRKTKLAQYNIGDNIVLGSYPQKADGTKKPIEWTILKKEGNKALLLSKHVLDAKLYNEKREEVTWEASDVRRWLNREFYGIAFNNKEKEKIQTTMIKTGDNPKYGTSGGNDTEDKVFLLSIKEAETLFSKDEERIAKATEYAQKSGVLVSQKNGNTWWWLRSPGSDGFSAAVVNISGWVSSDGFSVDDNDDGVRPALWLNL